MAAEKRPTFASPQLVDAKLQVSRSSGEAHVVHEQARASGAPAAPSRAGRTTATSPSSPRHSAPSVPMPTALTGGYFLTTPSLTEMNTETKEFMPSLATDWAFGADGKTRYYKLNEKAKWSDGTPVTSKDYLFMMKMMRSPNIQDPWYNEYYTTQIVDVKAYGDYVISVQSNAKSDPIELLLNTSTLAAAEQVLQRRHSCGLRGRVPVEGRAHGRPLLPGRLHKGGEPHLQEGEGLVGVRVRLQQVPVQHRHPGVQGHHGRQRHRAQLLLQRRPRPVLPDHPHRMGRCRNRGSHQKRLDRPGICLLRSPHGCERHHLQHEVPAVLRRERAPGDVLRNQHAEDDRHGAPRGILHATTTSASRMPSAGSPSTTTASASPTSTR